MHFALAKGLAMLVKKFSKKLDVCFSGGVASNELFNKFLTQFIPDLKVQNFVPCGDGGISLGQAYYMLTNSWI